MNETRHNPHATARNAIAEAADLERRLFKAEAEVANRTQVERDLLEQVRQLSSELEIVNSRLAAVLESTSWTLTAPMRAMASRWPILGRAARRIPRLIRRGLVRIGLNRVGRSAETAGSSLESQALANWFQQPSAPIAFEQEPNRDSGHDVAAPIRAENTGVARQRGGVFVAADMPPMYDKHAGSLRLHNLMQIIGSMGVPMLFGSLAGRDDFNFLAGSPDDRLRYEKTLREIGVSRIAYGFDEIKGALAETGSALRAAILSTPSVADRLIPAVRVQAPWANIIYDMVDFHALRMSREAQLKSDAALQLKADQMRLLELANARSADMTVAISEDERTALLELNPDLVVEVVPLVFDLSSIDLRSGTDREGLLFVGGFWHTPNVDGICWFAREIWPLIVRNRPDLTLFIVGSNATDEVRGLASQSGVEVLGYVPDLSELFNRSRVFVAPLRFGAGVKGKIGESMARGLPVVTTSLGTEGMHLRNGEEVLVADEPETFAAAVLRLLTDDELWNRLQGKGRSYVEEWQSTAKARSKIEKLLNG